MENEPADILTRLGEMALGCGFTQTGRLDTATIKVRQEVRDACATDKCHAYGKNWSCPPACGSLEECEKQLHQFKYGLLLQTSGSLEDSFDYEGIQQISEKHTENLKKFRAVLEGKKIAAHNTDCENPSGFMLLGAGACKECESCTYPGAPCRFPEKMTVSMEAMGLVVSDVCTAAGLPYYYGPNTMTFVGCVLLA